MNEANAFEDRLNAAMKRCVDREGKVDHQTLLDEKIVQDCVRRLESFDPRNLKSRNEALAFWINAYNMLTAFGVLAQLRRIQISQKREQWRLSKVPLLLVDRSIL